MNQYSNISINLYGLVNTIVVIHNKFKKAFCLMIITAMIVILSQKIIIAANYISYTFDLSYATTHKDDNGYYQICYAPCNIVVFDVGILNETEWPITGKEIPIHINKEVNSNYNKLFDLMIKIADKQIDYKMRKLNEISLDDIHPNKGYYFNIAIDLPNELQDNSEITYYFKIKKGGIKGVDENDYEGRGEIDISRKARIIIRKPNNDDEEIHASINKAETANFIGNHDEAQNILNNLLERQKDNKQALFKSGVWYMMNGRYNKASERFERLLELSKEQDVPDHLYEFCARSYFMSNKLEQAKRTYNRIRGNKIDFEKKKIEWKELETEREKNEKKNE